MKTQINLTTSCCDLDRFASRGELLVLLGTDGIELTCFEDDVRGIVPTERVTGLHMSCLPYWVDFWRGDRAACLREFDDAETVRAVFGGETPDALLAHYRRDLQHAQQYEAEYMVFQKSFQSL